MSLCVKRSRVERDDKSPYSEGAIARIKLEDFL